MKISPWTYDGQVPKDPINLLFLNVDISDVESPLRRDGWGNVSGFDHEILDPTSRNWRNQDAQFGLPATLHRRKYHLRLWENIGGNVIGSAHREDSVWKGHKLLDFKSAEKYIANLFEDEGWNVRYDQIELLNRVGGREEYYHNGLATEIER